MSALDGRSFVPVAVTDRSGHDESVHHGAIVALAADGSIVGAAGDPEVEVFARSALKPLQASAMLAAGFAGSPPQIAVACASHDGRPHHLEVVRSILDDAGLDESALRNTPAWPLDEDTADDVIRAGAAKSSLFQNCSGKHAAMVATCVVNGWQIESYLSEDHPLQVRITERIAELTGGVVHIGVDGCGAPAHVTSLVGVARAYGTLAREHGPVWSAMTEHPVLVGGDRQFGTRLMRHVPGLMAKPGAEGVLVAACDDGRAVAVKIADGASRASGVAAATGLAWIGVDVAPDVVRHEILGHGGAVGRVRSIVDRSEAT